MVYVNIRPYYLQDLRNAVVPVANTQAIEVRGNINGNKLTEVPEPLFTLGVSFIDIALHILYCIICSV